MPGDEGSWEDMQVLVPPDVPVSVDLVLGRNCTDQPEAISGDICSCSVFERLEPSF